MSFDGVPYSEALSEHALKHVDVERSEVQIVSDVLNLRNSSCEKIVILVDDSNKAAAIKGELRRIVEVDCRVVSASENLVELIDPSATKGAALYALYSQMGIDKASVMAIGDSETDMDMFAVAGIPIAVETASEEVRSTAIATCRPPEFNGVADVLEQYGVVEPIAKGAET